MLFRSHCCSLLQKNFARKWPLFPVCLSAVVGRACISSEMHMMRVLVFLGRIGLKVGKGQEWAQLSRRSPDYSWISRIHPFFHQIHWFPYEFWGIILKTKALSRFRRGLLLAELGKDLLLAASLWVGVCFHDFCNCPSIGETYTYDWQLITHPKDYSGEMEGKHSKILKLSKVNFFPFNYG
jgi:hypothetical protein